MAIKKLCLTSLGIILLVSAIGCAKQVHKTWDATGGSRADATIELSFDYYPATEQPILSDEQAMSTALQRCQSWGYQEVEPFGGTKRESVVENGAWGQTTRVIITKTYQCIGKGDKTVKGKA